MRLTIDRTWQGEPIGADEQVEVRLSAAGDRLRIDVDGPFHDDPAPPGPPGPTDALWEFEVVELFVVGSGDPVPYLEVELSPHGHHLVLRLLGVRSPVEKALPLSFEASIALDRWRGTALVDRHLLPPGPHRGNAFAIHGHGAARRYLASTATGGEAPDFHRLAHFPSLILP